MITNNGMFKLTVEFSTENAAFGDSREFEIDRILKQITYDVYNYNTKGRVVDFNGNLIGRWFIGDDVSYAEEDN